MSNFQMSNVAEPSVYSPSNQNAANLGMGSTAINMPPALPPRPYQTQRYGGWPSGSTYGSGFGGYGYSGYNGFGSYSNFGSFGQGIGYGGMYGGYNRMYGPNDMGNRFIQYAEESSRPAFQSIESVVYAFSGIAQMLDSTYMAMTTTFRAILSVADNFGRLHSLFARFWSTFALFRSINWFYRKLLSMLGLSKHDPQKIKAWAEALNGNKQDGDKNTSSWPILVFLGFITSAPYIMYKIFEGWNKSVVEKTSDPSTWDKPLLASALYDLSSSNPNELSLRTMQSVKVAPLEIQNEMKLMNTGWLLASTDNKTSGLVPANYIQIIKGNVNANTTDKVETK